MVWQHEHDEDVNWHPSTNELRTVEAMNDREWKDYARQNPNPLNVFLGARYPINLPFLDSAINSKLSSLSVDLKSAVNSPVEQRTVRAADFVAVLPSGVQEAAANAIVHAAGGGGSVTFYVNNHGGQHTDTVASGASDHGWEKEYDRRSSSKKLFSLAHPKSELRHLSWTSYLDLPFRERMSPLLETRIHATGLSSYSVNFQTILSEPFDLTPDAMKLSLPSLRTLKVSLDNGMFAVLTSWDMPHLRNLSVVSADFSYTGAGFYKLFFTHGASILRLELGHSSSVVGGHCLATPSTRQTQPARAAVTRTFLPEPARARVLRGRRVVLGVG